MTSDDAIGTSRATDTIEVFTDNNGRKVAGESDMEISPGSGVVNQNTMDTIAAAADAGDVRIHNTMNYEASLQNVEESQSDKSDKQSRNDNNVNNNVDDEEENQLTADKNAALRNNTTDGVSSADEADESFEDAIAIPEVSKSKQRTKEFKPPANLDLSTRSRESSTTLDSSGIDNLSNLLTSPTSVASSDALCCPITPGGVVDMHESDDDRSQSSNFILRSSSSKAIMNSSKNVKNSNETLDEDPDDIEDEQEPDGEVLVQFLGEANRIAEARLAARRQARAEAREIRMRELERQQKEQEQNADRVFDLHTASGMDPLARNRLTAGLSSTSSPVGSVLNSTRGNSMSSRRSSEDSLEEEGRSLRDIRYELKDVEERFRKAMIANAQLDNERSSQTYQIQLLKDKLEEMEESYAQLQREYKEKSRDCNALKRNLDKLSEELKLVQGQLSERDALIAEQGLVIVTVENEDGSDAKRALVSCENAHLLGSVQGSLDVRLKKFHEEKQQLVAEVQRLQEQLDNHKSQGKGRGSSGAGSTMNGPSNADDDEYEAQREANKIISDYKYKLQKAEQEIANLQASLARSETQVIRYKSTAEAAEKAEAELKIERRKLQRENRETMERLEELETSNNHLLKRLDKLKNAKSALLKDL